MRVASHGFEVAAGTVRPISLGPARPPLSVSSRLYTNNTPPRQTELVYYWTQRGKEEGKHQGIHHGLLSEPGLMLNGIRCGFYLAYVSHEPISPFRHRLDIQRRFPIIAKVLPQSEDILRERGLLDKRIRPYLLQELVFAQRPPTVFHKNHQCLVGLWS